MPAPKGHPMWGNPIKPKKYTPEGYWEKSLEYFEWCDKNPWTKTETIIKGDRVEIKNVPTQRPYTIQGLCRFLNISFETFSNYSSKKGYETYFEVSHAIRQVIENNQLEGATVGTYNANIIGRLLGLVDKQKLEHSGEIKQKDDLSKYSTDELVKRAEAINKLSNDKA